jgi:hypothetical protein
MSVEAHESALRRFPWNFIFPSKTSEGYRRSVISLSLYSAVVGIVVIAFLILTFMHTSSVSAGIASVALILLLSAISMSLFSTVVLIRVKWLRKFGRAELVGVAIVLLNLNVATDIFPVWMFFDRPGFARLLYLVASIIFGLVVSIRYLLRGRAFVDSAHDHSQARGAARVFY